MTMIRDVVVGGRSFAAMNYTAASTSMPVTIPPSGRRERKQGERAVQANFSLNPDASPAALTRRPLGAG